MTVRAGVDGAGGAGGGAGGSGTLTASGLSLPVNQLLLGNTYPDTKPLGTLGTTTTLLHGNAAGAPTFAAVSLTADVTGTLPVANGGTGITSLGTGVATFLGTPSSANLLAAVTGATGTGAAVFGTSPTFTTGLTTPVATITQGTISADAPLLDLSSTWNGAGIVGPAIKLNVTDTSSNASALLADLGVGGGSYVSKWKLDKTGKVTQTGNLLGPNGTGAAPTYSFASSTGTGMYLSTALELGIGLGSLYYDFTQNYFSLRGSNTLKLGFGTSIDTQLQRDGTANIPCLAQRCQRQYWEDLQHLYIKH